MGSLVWSIPSNKTALADPAQKPGRRRKPKDHLAIEVARITNSPAPKERDIEHKPEPAALEAIALVNRCLQGDPHAWQQLVQTQHRRIYGICYRFTGCYADAEDLTQDVFLKVYRNLEQFDLKRGSFQTWLTSLTRNLLVDHFRRSGPDRKTSSIDVGWNDPEEPPALSERLQDTRSGPHEHSVNRELQHMVQKALLQVSPELREAVILRDLKEMDYKEIAQVLNIPEGTVKSRISRGRMELARLLQRTKGQVM